MNAANAAMPIALRAKIRNRARSVGAVRNVSASMMVHDTPK